MAIEAVLELKNMTCEKVLSGHKAIQMVKDRIELIKSDPSVPFFKLFLVDYCMPILDGP